VQNDNTEKLKEDTVTAKKMLDVEQSKIPPGGTGCSILEKTCPADNFFTFVKLFIRKIL